MQKPEYATSVMLAETRQVTFDANGEGIIDNVGPIQSYEQWDIQYITSQITNNGTKDSELRVYQYGAVVDSTYTANLNTSGNTYLLMPGQKLTFKYRAGTPGALATISVHGRRLIRSR